LEIAIAGREAVEGISVIAVVLFHGKELGPGGLGGREVAIPVEIAFTDGSHADLVPRRILVFDVDHGDSATEVSDELLEVYSGMDDPIGVDLKKEIRSARFSHDLKWRFAFRTHSFEFEGVVVIGEEEASGL